MAKISVAPREGARVLGFFQDPFIEFQPAEFPV